MSMCMPHSKARSPMEETEVPKQASAPAILTRTGYSAYGQRPKRWAIRQSKRAPGKGTTGESNTAAVHSDLLRPAQVSALGWNGHAACRRALTSKSRVARRKGSGRKKTAPASARTSGLCGQSPRLCSFTCSLKRVSYLFTDSCFTSRNKTSWRKADISSAKSLYFEVW